MFQCCVETIIKSNKSSNVNQLWWLVSVNAVKTYSLFAQRSKHGILRQHLWRDRERGPCWHHPYNCQSSQITLVVNELLHHTLLDVGSSPSYAC